MAPFYATVDIRDRLENLGEIEVKNIPRPVRVYRVLSEGKSAPVPRGRGRIADRPQHGRTGGHRRRDRRLVVAAMPGLHARRSGPDGAHPARKALDRLLPFENLSEDGGKVVFSDGIITDLSWSRGEARWLGPYGHHSVSSPRSSNRTCGFPASGFPTGFTSKHTAGGQDGPDVVGSHRAPRTRPYRGNAWCRATTPYGA